MWEEIKKLGFPVAVSLEAAFYFSNFDGNPVMSFTKGDDGAAVFKFPILSADQKVAGFDTNDLGEGGMCMLGAVWYGPGPDVGMPGLADEVYEHMQMSVCAHMWRPGGGGGQGGGQGGRTPGGMCTWVYAFACMHFPTSLQAEVPMPMPALPMPQSALY